MPKKKAVPAKKPVQPDPPKLNDPVRFVVWWHQNPKSLRLVLMLLDVDTGNQYLQLHDTDTPQMLMVPAHGMHKTISIGIFEFAEKIGAIVPDPPETEKEEKTEESPPPEKTIEKDIASKEEETSEDLDD